LKNLLSNAFKFTQQGQVTLLIEPAKSGWDAGNESLNRASDVIAFSVMDTGIGISPDKQQIIFGAFQQAVGSTSRKYGGTGLGLAISRDLARLLGDAARERGFKAITTSSGAEAVGMIAEYKPAAITLDISLPDIKGWRVLDRLKNDIATQHIPVAVISTDDSRERALAAGAHTFVAKPVQSK